jgi:hypothetical protein
MNKDLLEGLVIGGVAGSLMNQQRTPKEQLAFERELQRLRNRTPAQEEAERVADEAKSIFLLYFGLFVATFFFPWICIPIWMLIGICYLIRGLVVVGQAAVEKPARFWIMDLPWNICKGVFSVIASVCILMSVVLYGVVAGASIIACIMALCMIAKGGVYQIVLTCGSVPATMLICWSWYKLQMWAKRTGHYVT